MAGVQHGASKASLIRMMANLPATLYTGRYFRHTMLRIIMPKDPRSNLPAVLGILLIRRVSSEDVRKIDTEASM